MIDTINQVFSLFSLNFHNQYYAAFKEPELEIQAKRLWLETLRQQEPEVLLRAAKSIISHSEYLPTLHTMLEHCQRVRGEHLPDAHAAYVEACQAPSPKSAADWSHLAVYYAGKATDWYFLATNTESVALPVFKRHYQEICQRVKDGESLPKPQVPALPEHSETPLESDQQRQKLAELRKHLDL